MKNIGRFSAAFSVVLVFSGSLVLANSSTRPDLTTKDSQRVAAVTAPTLSFDAPEKFESMQGGAGTSRSPLDRHAFSQPLTNLSFSGREQFSLGNALFRKIWVSSPATTQASDGLGPFFNARGCQSCHIQDGRGHLPENDEIASSFLLHLGRYDASNKRWTGDTRYGNQLQTAAVQGHLAEGVVNIDYTEKVVKFTDGEKLLLRRPSFSIDKLAYGAMDEQTELSPRIAPPMIGMGLLAAISETDILFHEDPKDSDGDGISGRASRIMDEVGTRVGRFTLKAAQPDVREQSAAAFSSDMGLSSSLQPGHSGDCTAGQPHCMGAPHGEQARLGKNEVPDELLDLVTFYSSNLAPPVRRDVSDADVLQGKALFYGAGCTGCHVPKYVTSRDAEEAHHQFQLIWPYTDLLVHDMGEELADGAGHNGGVSGEEWRTPPLWGIGLTKTVNERATWLHDGRARSLLEAVMWHGGEAERARNVVLAMPGQQRKQLIRFLESL
ncbi:MAG: di-heme oxidoredictase family protein [Granulosicoccus sp.]